MKKLQLTKKNIFLSSLIAVFILAGIISSAVYISAHNGSKAKSTTSSVTVEKKAETINKEDTSASSEEANIPEDTQSTISKTPSTANANQTNSVESTEQSEADKQLTSQCNLTSNFINSRFVSRLDANGNPYYSNNQALLDDLKRTSDTYYTFYEQCVAAGKIQSL